MGKRLYATGERPARKLCTGYYAYIQNAKTKGVAKVFNDYRYSTTVLYILYS